MKKLFVLSFASILMLTGCGATETLSCSYSNNANNGTTKVTYDIDHEANEIKKVRITYKYDFDTNTETNNDGTANNARIGGNNTGTTGDGTNGNNDANTVNGDNTMNNDNTGTDGTTGTNNGTVDTTNDTGITGYTNDNDDDVHQDGVGTGTDGTTNDTYRDDDGVVDGVVGSVIDTIVGGVTGIILDSAGLRDRHANVQNTYGNVNGFSVQNTNDADNNYTVTYVIDYDTISDTDLAGLNLTRNLDDMRTNYVNQGFTCK